MNEFFNYSFETFISSIHSIAKMNPEYLDLMLTDYNLNLVLEDVDDKMIKSYKNYLEYRNLFLNFNSNDIGFYTLYKSLIQKYFLELNTLYNLHLIYFNILNSRKQNFNFKSNIDDIKLLCDSEDYGIILNK